MKPVLLTITVVLLLTLSAAEGNSSRPGSQGIVREPARSSDVTAITSEIVIDGFLNEAPWQTAPKIGELIQKEPRAGEQPSERTDVTLLRDADNLYIGVVCYDSEPDKVIGTEMERDANLGADDRLTLVLDTFRDQRSAFYFATNPAGALVDGLVFANGQSNLEWDAIWSVRTKRSKDGWTAEFAIPFKSLSFPSGQTVWGFNIGRYIQRRLEEDRWSGARVETQFFQVSEAGEITNLDGLTQGIGFNIRPFTAGRWLRTAANHNDSLTGKPGLDLFYNFTPSLKLSATVNTDFGETEVDAREINLTRFSILFPEKRSFFLEDAGVFTLSDVRPTRGIPATRSEVIPFFSRQIGLLGGEEVPIDFGLKLTGKVGRTDLGVLDVRTRDLPKAAEKNFFVGRIKRNLLQQSYVAGIFTNGHPGLPIASSTFGGDVRLGSSRFLGGRRNVALNSYALRSVNEGTSGKDWSYGISAEYPNNETEMEFIWRDVQQNFRPALGFVSRRNVRLLRAGGRYNPLPKDFLNLQQMFHGVYYTRFTRLDNGQVESWNLHFATIDWHFKTGDSIHALLSPQAITYERLFAPFEISPGVILAPGEYRFTRWRTNIQSAAKRRLQGSAVWLFGNYWSGRAQELSTMIQYKIPPGFNFTFNTNQTFARLPEGNFVARILTWQVNYAASPYLAFSNLIQYDNRSRNLGWQSRVRWILQPGNDLFLVFSQGWIQDINRDYAFRAQDTKVSAKFQYTFRF
jgi:hypothetical protein